MSSKKFPIVGIGASAGGLEAFSAFFDHMPADADMAFVLIPHLAPQHESLMSELLKRNTDMPVVEATDNLRVKKDHVYLIPPNSLMRLAKGRLRLESMDISAPRRPPIDIFFTSLAEDQKHMAICIVLSGTGTDGVHGLRAIKEHGGMAMAQSEGARYDGMPQSALATGLVDYEKRVEDMPRTLVEYAQHLAHIDQNGKAETLMKKGNNNLAKILGYVNARTGHDFRQYKTSTLTRRVQRRMQVTHSPSPSAYYSYLRSKPGEATQLLNDLLIGVTHFFRDHAVFESLEKKVIPKLVENARKSEEIRVWTPGCASGEETYSIGMMILEATRAIDSSVSVTLFGTDIDRSALEAARQGSFPDSAAAYIPERYLQRYVMQSAPRIQISKALREACIFSQHNLINDPPFSRLDLVSCRNLLIYFSTELQHRIVPLFHYALRPGGFLMLGPSESLTGFEDLFETVDKEARLFRRKDAPRRDEWQFPMRSKAEETVAGGRANDQIASVPSLRPGRLAEKYLLDRYTPACVVVDQRNQIVHFSGRTGLYLEHPPGAPDMYLLSLAKTGLRQPLRQLLRESRANSAAVVRDDIQVRNNGRACSLRIEVRPAGMAAHDHYLVIFERQDAPEGDGEKGGDEPETLTLAEQSIVEQLEADLEATREQLQTTIEELETSNEELRSSNEELMSMNEELQSTIEEHETSKEELRSFNEELETVNSELNSKLAELDRANADLANLLSGTEIATLFLDRELNIKRFTPEALTLFSLVDTDVGRPLADISPKYDDGEYLEDARTVLRTAEPIEREVTSKNQRVFSMRILPYRSQEGVVDGAVLVFVDVTELKAAQEEVFKLRTEQQLKRSERLAALGTLSAGVAHEVNNVLNAISLNAEVGNSSDSNTEARSQFEKIIEQVRAGGLVTRNLIAFARADKVQPVATPLKPILERARDHMRHELNKADVQCKIDTEPDIPAVRADAVALQHAITNMIQNSVHAECSNLWITARPESNSVRLEIRDDGVGIKDFEIDDVFEPFFTTRRHQGGTGLGLSFVHRVVSEIGGGIQAIPVEDGALFVIDLAVLSEGSV